MLKSITLENYKCFQDKTTIDIAPLTVLCGVNSSGKSSILKSLLTLKQSYENESSSQYLLLSGNYVDNGSFDDVVYHKNRNDITSEDTFTISSSYLIHDSSNEWGKNPVKRQDIATFKELKRVFYHVTNIRKVKYFKISIEIVAQRPSKELTSFEFYIESNIIKNYNVTLELLDDKKEKIDNTTRSICVEKNFSNEDEKDYWTLNVQGIPSARGNDILTLSDYECICYFSGLQIKNLYADSMHRDVIYALPNLLSIFKIAAFQTDGFNFIAPLREQPVRRYTLNGDVNSVGISGEKTPVLLAREKSNYKTECVPPVYTGSDNLPKWEIKRDSFKNLVQSWMSYLKLGKISLTNSNNGIVEININNHNIVDVGFGVSQALPIIVQGLYMSKDQTLILEQPEIHLHPEMQLHMADFLISLAKNEKSVIVETHSDHIINRIIKRCMEDHELCSSVKPLIRIIFLDRDENNQPRKTDIEIDKYKGVVNAPENFFSQFGSEMMDISKKGYENYKKDLKQ